MILGVVADDITGSGDIGSMTAKAGFLTHIYHHEARLPLAGDVCILDTDSRFDDVAVAHHKVFAATKRLQAAGCKQFYKKTCSVLRGNIGAEFDAMLDALGEDFGVVVAGFPKNGRITLGGIHYVNGVKLEDSAFRHDPVHPMTHSSLIEILQAQTERKVAHLGHEVVAQGQAAIRRALGEMRARATYVILDVADQRALETIAGALKEARVLLGSSALAEPLSALWVEAPSHPAAQAVPEAGSAGVLVIAGSLTPQTVAQVAYLKARMHVLRLDTTRIFGAQAQRELKRLALEAQAALAAGEDVLVHSANDGATVTATKEEGARRGLSRPEVSRLVSTALADIAAACDARPGFHGLVVAGGDTSEAVCRRLGVRGLRVLEEIQPGVPSGLSLPEAGARPRLLVLKSGSFGTDDFLAQAVAHLKETQLGETQLREEGNASGT